MNAAGLHSCCGRGLASIFLHLRPIGVGHLHATGSGNRNCRSIHDCGCPGDPMTRALWKRDDWRRAAATFAGDLAKTHDQAMIRSAEKCSNSYARENEQQERMVRWRVDPLLVLGCTLQMVRRTKSARIRSCKLQRVRLLCFAH